MKKTPIISASMAEDGQVLTTIEGAGGDVLEMLAMLNRSVALIMLEAGNTPAVIAETLQALAAAGLGMATEDEGGGKTDE